LNFRLLAEASLRRDEEFANLGHADGAGAGQRAEDRAQNRIFREPERIARGELVSDHQQFIPDASGASDPG